MGIDPGLGGAIAFYQPLITELVVYPTPTYWVTVKDKRRRRLDMPALHDILRKNPVKGATLESVHAMPSQGVASSFSFGQVFGATEQCLVCNGVKTRLVQPRQWKQFFGLSADKTEARVLAAQRFPRYAYLFARKTDDGNAEAALLALYGFLNES